MSAEELLGATSAAEKPTVAPATKTETPVESHHAQAAALVTENPDSLDAHPRVNVAAVAEAPAPIEPHGKSLAGTVTEQVAAPTGEPKEMSEQDATDRKVAEQENKMVADQEAQNSAAIQSQAASQQATPGQVDIQAILPLLQAQPRDGLTDFFREMITQQSKAEGRDLSPEEIEGHALFMRFLLEANKRKAQGMDPIPEGITIDPQTRATIGVAIEEFGKRMNENNMDASQVTAAADASANPAAAMQPPVTVNQKIVNDLVNYQKVIDGNVKHSKGDGVMANIVGSGYGLATAATAVLGMVVVKGFDVFKRTNDFVADDKLSDKVENAGRYMNRLLQKIVDTDQRGSLKEQTIEVLKDGFAKGNRVKTTGFILGVTAASVAVGAVISLATRSFARALQDRKTGVAYRKIDEALEPLSAEEQTATLNAWQERLVQNDMAPSLGKGR